MAFTLGWRKREVLGLQRRHLDLDAGTLRLDPGKTKNREGRMAYLTPELRAALVAQVADVDALQRKTGRIIACLFPHLEGQHVGERIQDLRKAWAEACRMAGRPGVLIHDLRRSAVRNMEQAEVPRSGAMKISGHKDGGDLAPVCHRKRCGLGSGSPAAGGSVRNPASEVLEKVNPRPRYHVFYHVLGDEGSEIGCK